VWIKDTEELEFEELKDKLRKEKIKSFIVLPLKLHLNPIGILSLYFTKKNALKNSDLRILDIILPFISGLLSNSQLIKRLKESEQRMKLVFDNSPVLIGIIQDHKIILGNKTAEILTGYSFEEIKSKNFWEFIHPDDGETVKERGIRRERGEKVFPSTYECKIITKNGEIKTVELTGNSIIYNGRPANLFTLLDITEKKQLEKEVHELQENLRAIYENSPIGIYLLSINKDKYTYELFNPEGRKILGMDIEGKSPEELFPKEDAEKARRIVETIIRTKKTLVSNEEYHTKYGKRVLQVRRAPVFDQKGNVVKIVGIFRDITEELKAEKEAKRKLKFEVIGKLSREIAHSFNNILSVIISSSEVEQRKNPGNKVLEKIREKAVEASNIVAEIMELGKAASGNMRRLDFSKFLEEYKAFIRAIVPKTIKIKTQIQDRNLTIRGNITLLKTLINNLILNARDACDENGRIEIKLRKAKKIHESPSKEGEFMELLIKNNGKGMSEEEILEAFKPFYTTKSDESMGLGLYLAKSIVEKHHGYIEIDSTPGKGTEAKVYIPLLTADNKNTNKDLPKTRQRKATKFIMLVEDDPDVLEVEREIVHMLGYKTLEAENGKEALEIFKKRHEQIIAVLTDLSMPKIGGLALAKKIKQISPSTKVIIISGYITMDEVEIMHNEGVDGVLQKPFELENFMRKLSNILK